MFKLKLIVFLCHFLNLGHDFFLPQTFVCSLPLVQNVDPSLGVLILHMNTFYLYLSLSLFLHHLCIQSFSSLNFSHTMFQNSSPQCTVCTTNVLSFSFLTCFIADIPPPFYQFNKFQFWQYYYFNNSFTNYFSLFCTTTFTSYTFPVTNVKFPLSPSLMLLFLTFIYSSKFNLYFL